MGVGEGVLLLSGIDSEVAGLRGGTCCLDSGVTSLKGGTCFLDSGVVGFRGGTCCLDSGVTGTAADMSQLGGSRPILDEWCDSEACQ